MQVHLVHVVKSELLEAVYVLRQAQKGSGVSASGPYHVDRADCKPPGARDLELCTEWNGRTKPKTGSQPLPRGVHASLGTSHGAHRRPPPRTHHRRAAMLHRAPRGLILSGELSHFEWGMEVIGDTGTGTMRQLRQPLRAGDGWNSRPLLCSRAPADPPPLTHRAERRKLRAARAAARELAFVRRLFLV